MTENKTAEPCCPNCGGLVSQCGCDDQTVEFSPWWIGYRAGLLYGKAQGRREGAERGVWFGFIHGLVWADATYKGEGDLPDPELQYVHFCEADEGIESERDKCVRLAMDLTAMPRNPAAVAEGGGE